ncbi:hypothetical protein TNCV_1478041 [Trichonephila clavipes]|nr:hypothetical protein TNCV_1478041 [Trichonephila clavipes]
MFSPLPAENSPVLETITTKFNIIPSTSQAIKQTSKTRRKKRPNGSITPQTEIQMTPHKPKKKHTFAGHVRGGPCLSMTSMRKKKGM